MAGGKKARTRVRILESAARLITREGPLGASVARVMSGAGLTTGGFYAHYSSKDEMLAESLLVAARRAFARLEEGLDEVSGPRRWRMMVERYLSEKHVSNLDSGCGLPASLSALAHYEPTYEAMGEVVELFISKLEPHDPAQDHALQNGLSAREHSMATIATLVGTLSLARALGPGKLSQELIRASTKLVLPERKN